MSNIFSLPRVQSLPGAKLTFSISGSTTLQNTYQDVNLTTPHTNPVVADAEGYFDPIYLDPSLPNYRIKHTTSADVLIEQLDGIPATGSTGRSLLLSAAGSSLTLEDEAQASGERRWKLYLSGSSIILGTADDDGTPTGEAITMERSGGFVTRLELSAIDLFLNSVQVTPRAAVKLVTTSRASTTTYANDPELSLDVTEGGNYEIELFLCVVGSGVSGAGGFKQRVNYSGTVGAKGIYAGGIGSMNSSKAVLDLISMEAGSSYASIVAAGNGEYEHWRGFAHFSTTGTLRVQWAQNSSNAADTNLLAGSFLRLTKLTSVTS